MPGGLPLWGGSRGRGREGGEGREASAAPESTRKPAWVPRLCTALRSMGCVLCAWLRVRGAEARQTLPWLPWAHGVQVRGKGACQEAARVVGCEAGDLAVQNRRSEPAKGDSPPAAGEAEMILALRCQPHPDTNSSWAALDWARGGAEAASFCFAGDWREGGQRGGCGPRLKQRRDAQRLAPDCHQKDLSLPGAAPGAAFPLNLPDARLNQALRPLAESSPPPPESLHLGRKCLYSQPSTPKGSGPPAGASQAGEETGKGEEEEEARCPTELQTELRG